jgi:Protein of unknown function (DUF3048) N-terminal domain/Protein of unknown function (DUF3048) C-terminal domain
MLKTAVLAGIIVLVALTGCITILPGQAQDKQPTPAIAIIPLPTRGPDAVVAVAIGPNNYADTINPLTGLAVPDAVQLNRRPLVVKISNSPALVRPQAGLGAADLVFEHYTEVGITRFSAIFYTNAPQRVGSLRSARLIDYELVPMYQGLLAFAGVSIGVDKRIYGSAAVIEALCRSRDDKEQCHAEADAIGPAGFVPPSDFVDRAYKGVLYGAPYFYRDEEIPVPHNLFANLEALWRLAEADGNGGRPALQGMAFHATPQGTPTGSGVYTQVRYQTTLVEWHYDAATGRYYRSTDGQRHFDANTEEQISAANVVIIYAGHFLTDIIESQFQDTIHWSAQITIWPAGDAIILRDGVHYAGRWLRPTRTALLTFETVAGELIYLKPGNTWFQLVRTPEQMNPETEWVTVE